MMVSNAPHFKEVLKTANELLIRDGLINDFPFRAKQVISSCSPMSCCSYDKAKKYGFSPEDLGSRSALTAWKLGRKIIFYNNHEERARGTWSLIHELGHDKLEHPLNPEQYPNKEIEAHFFTAQLLMPEQLIREIERRGVKITVPLLQCCFGVSKEAAEKRIQTLNKINWNWRSDEEKWFDDCIIQKFSDFLNKVKPTQKDYTEEMFDLEQERASWSF